MGATRNFTWALKIQYEFYDFSMSNHDLDRKSRFEGVVRVHRGVRPARNSRGSEMDRSANNLTIAKTMPMGPCGNPQPGQYSFPRLSMDENQNDRSGFLSLFPIIHLCLDRLCTQCRLFTGCRSDHSFQSRDEHHAQGLSQCLQLDTACDLVSSWFTDQLVTSLIWQGLSSFIKRLWQSKRITVSPLKVR